MVIKKKLKRPEKEPNLLLKIKEAINSGNYRDVTHALERSIERAITRAEYLYVLKNGRHEKKKDEFKEEYNNWNYAIRGKTLDEKELRVIVSFEENGLLVITVIDLELK
ncbi:MAG: DUF4258 domain-containing protein [Candidatus Sericytochromatia bacterium]